MMKEGSFQPCSIHGVNYLRYPFGEAEKKRFEQNFYLNEDEIDSDVTITITFDNRQSIPINVLRQENFVNFDYERFSKVNIPSNSSFQEINELLRQEFKLENCRVWYLKCYYPELVNDCRILGEQIMDEYVRDVDKKQKPITSKGIFLMEEQDNVVDEIQEDSILCFIFRTNGSNHIFVKTLIIHKNNDDDDRKILFDKSLEIILKTNAGFQEDDSTSIKYSNRPFDISQVDLALGEKYLIGNFSKIFVKDTNYSQ